MNGRWIGYGVSTIVGKFELAVTNQELNVGLSGIVSTSHGFNSAFFGYIDGSSLDFIALP